MPMKTAVTAVFRFSLNSSMAEAMITSITEIDEVRAARSNAKKKRMAMMPPIGNLPKMNGKVVNTRPGPSLGLMPKANTAGMMAQPAISAKAVSASAVCTESERIRSCFFTYEP